VISRMHRFHGRGSLHRHYNQSKSVRSGFFSLRYATNTRRTNYRAAVVVSRKVSKSAFVRNRIRRRVYENVRILFKSADKPVDLVFMVYDARVAHMPAPELTAEITKLCQKAGLTPVVHHQRAIVEPKD
jgi:ribonuclease P protein component